MIYPLIKLQNNKKCTTKKRGRKQMTTTWEPLARYPVLTTAEHNRTIPEDQPATSTLTAMFLGLAPPSADQTTLKTIVGLFPRWSRVNGHDGEQLLHPRDRVIVGRQAMIVYNAPGKYSWNSSKERPSQTALDCPVFSL